MARDPLGVRESRDLPTVTCSSGLGAESWVRNTQDEKKVCYTVVQTIHFVLIIPFIVTQKYKFLAVAAVRVSSLHPLALDGLTRVLL